MGVYANIASVYHVEHVQSKTPPDKFLEILDKAQELDEDLISWQEDDGTKKYELSRKSLQGLCDSKDPVVAKWAIDLLLKGDKTNDFIRVEIY